jgi:hypothetical protein
MAGKLFYNDVRLDRAHAEGLGAADGATNPHPAGTPEHDAWAGGAAEANPPVPPDKLTKTQLKELLDGLSIDYPSDATKAELQTLAGIN